MGLTIGITGGIGSGKTTVCIILNSIGIITISADTHADEIIASDQSVQNEIEGFFGRKAFLNGELNRRHIAEKIFKDPAARRRLNEIVHPRVLKSIQDQISLSSSQNSSSYYIIEAALMFESGLANKMDYVLGVIAEKSKRISRLLERPGLVETEILNRMDSQLSDTEFEKKSDFLIYNNSTIEELRATTLFYHHLFLQLSKKKQ